MLDSKDTTYIGKITNLVEIIMNTCPENFIETFIREGVVDNIKSIINCEESNFYVPDERISLSSNFGLKTKPIANPGYAENNELLNNEYNSNYSDQYNSYDDEIEFIDKTITKTSLDTKTPASDLKIGKSIQINNPTIQSNPSNSNVAIEKNPNPMTNIFNQMKSIFKKNEVFSDSTVNTTLNPPKEKIADKILKNENKEEKVTESVFNIPAFSSNNTLIVNNSKSKKPTNNSVMIIKNRCKDIIEKYFKDNETLEEYLKNANCISSPQEIISKLSYLSKMIGEKDDVDDETLIQLFDMLINKNQKLTFYEIEKSLIIHNLTKYIDSNYHLNLEKNSEKFECMLKTPNVEFLRKLKRLFKVLISQNKNISDFIATLQYSISSMNCFKLYLYEYDNYKNVSHLFFAPLKHNNYKFKIVFNYLKSDSLQISNDYINIDEQTDKYIKEVNDYYSQIKHIVFHLDQTDTFDNISELLLSKSKSNETATIPKAKNTIQKLPKVVDTQKQIYEEILNSIKEEDSDNSSKLIDKLFEKNINLNHLSQTLGQGIDYKNSEEDYEMEEQKELKSEEYSEDQEKVLNTQNITKSEDINKCSNEVKTLSSKYITNFYIIVNQEKHKIKGSWSLIEFFREAKNMIKCDITNLYDIQIFFEFVHFKDSESNKIDESNIFNKDIDMDIVMLNSTLENMMNIQEKFFFKNYSENILGNKALYTIKRASPFFYLIALFELCVNNYNELFNVKQRIDEKYLENHKVSSLLSKQVRDPFAISSNTIPTWCKDLCQNYPFLSNFNSRYLFFKTCSFDNKRSMINLAIFVKNFLGETIVDEKVLAGSTKRKKYKVDRNNLLQSVEKIYYDVGNFNVYIV